MCKPLAFHRIDRIPIGEHRIGCWWTLVQPHRHLLTSTPSKVRHATGTFTEACVLCRIFFLCESFAGADPGFFLGGGALVSCSTSTPINRIVCFFFLHNTSCIRKPQVISPHPPPRSAPGLAAIVLIPLCAFLSQCRSCDDHVIWSFVLFEIKSTWRHDYVHFWKSNNKQGLVSSSWLWNSICFLRDSPIKRTAFLYGQL